MLIWKAFQSKEEWCFPFGNIFFLFRDIYVFVLCKWGKWWRHGWFTKTVQHSIKNISRNIEAVFFKLGTRNVHHKRNRMTPMLLPWQHSRLQFLSVKNQISPFAIFLSETEGLAQHTNVSHIALTLPIRLLWVDDPCLGYNLGILVFIKTGPAA